jgi:hypothetical protein
VKRGRSVPEDTAYSGDVVRHIRLLAMVWIASWWVLDCQSNGAATSRLQRFPYPSVGDKATPDGPPVFAVAFPCYLLLATAVIPLPSLLTVYSTITSCNLLMLANMLARAGLLKNFSDT